MIKEWLAKFKSMIKEATVEVPSSGKENLVSSLQKSLEYCIEENKVLREVLQDTYECKRVKLTSDQKRRLAAKAITLDKHILSNLANIFQPETVLGWYRELVGKKYDSSKVEGKKRGPKPLSAEYVAQILFFAGRNPDWGYRRIASCMTHVGMPVSKGTVKRVLDDHGIVPEPEHSKRMDWCRFIETHRHIMAATDFFTVEVVTPHGLVRHMVMFFIDLATRSVELAGVRVDPHGGWMEQIARNATDYVDGFLRNKKYLICDRDPLFTQKFREILKVAGVTVKRTPSYTPTMNGFAKAFVKRIKTECINRIIITSEEQLHYVLKEYLEYYNHERPHRGLDGRFIDPWPQDADGEVVEFSRLGGLLRSYRRAKLASLDLPMAA